MLTPKEVRHVAMLARLGLTDEEVEKMREQLLQILDYVDQLQRLDTSQIVPTAQGIAQANVTRPDEARPSWDVERLLASAPAAEEDFIRVPAVFDDVREEGEGGEAGGAENG